jgi:hypothetical protein
MREERLFGVMQPTLDAQTEEAKDPTTNVTGDITSVIEYESPGDEYVSQDSPPDGGSQGQDASLHFGIRGDIDGSGPYPTADGSFYLQV